MFFPEYYEMGENARESRKKTQKKTVRRALARRTA